MGRHSPWPSQVRLCRRDLHTSARRSNSRTARRCCGCRSLPGCRSMRRRRCRRSRWPRTRSASPSRRVDRGARCTEGRGGQRGGGRRGAGRRAAAAGRQDRHSRQCTERSNVPHDIPKLVFVDINPWSTRGCEKGCRAIGYARRFTGPDRLCRMAVRIGRGVPALSSRDDDHTLHNVRETHFREPSRSVPENGP